MASLLFKDMKGVSLSCASPASAAVCTKITKRSTRKRDTKTGTKAKSYIPKSRDCPEKKNRVIEQASPAGSSRFLLSDAPSFHKASQIDSEIICCKEETEAQSSSNSATKDQVVILRVSLHCKGCEGKVRKHISKMEGVTSCEIDMAKKKVTVVGNITPLRVLSSVSKVKNAQLWPSPPPSSTVL